MRLRNSVSHFSSSFTTRPRLHFRILEFFSCWHSCLISFYICGLILSIFLPMFSINYVRSVYLLFFFHIRSTKSKYLYISQIMSWSHRYKICIIPVRSHILVWQPFLFFVYKLNYFPICMTAVSSQIFSGLFLSLQNRSRDWISSFWHKTEYLHFRECFMNVLIMLCLFHLWISVIRIIHFFLKISILPSVFLLL